MEAGRTPERPQRGEFLALVAILVLGAGLRCGSLGLQSFWFDESATADVVGLPGLGDVLDRVAESESTPPLYYVLTWAWAKLAGQGDLALRSVSAIAGTAVIPMAWAAARKLADGPAALVAAGFVAVSPLMLNYSQEARSYELLTFLCAASFLLTLVVVGEARVKPLVGWVGVSVAALATHYFAVFLLIPEAAFLLWRSPARKRVAGACGVLAAGGLALLPLFLEQRSHGATDWISGSDLTLRLRDTGHQFTKGVIAAPGSGLGALAIALVVLALVAVALAPAQRRTPAQYALAIGAAATVLPLLLALAGTDVFLFRNVQGAWVPLAVGLAVGLSARRAGLAVAGALCLVWIAIWVGVLRDESLHRDDWEGAAKALEAPRSDRALVITPGYAGAPLARYGHFGAPVEDEPIEVRELVLIGNYDSRSAGPVFDRFRLVERRQIQRIGIARYRSPRAVQLGQDQFAPPGSPAATPRLYLEPGSPPG